MNRILLACLLVPLIDGAASPMGWRGSNEPNITAVFDQPYDVAREKPFEGVILRIDPAPCAATPVSSFHFHIQMGKETVEIHMGPCWYIAEQKTALQVGDHISGIGSEATWRSGDRRVIIARELHRGKDVFRLRDPNGKPAWEH